jgi:hypothetical protein
MLFGVWPSEIPRSTQEGMMTKFTLSDRHIVEFFSKHLYHEAKWKVLAKSDLISEGKFPKSLFFSDCFYSSTCVIFELGLRKLRDFKCLSFTTPVVKNNAFAIQNTFVERSNVVYSYLCENLFLDVFALYLEMTFLYNHIP